VALTSSGTLAQCGEAAAALLRSKLEPCFVVAVPKASEGNCRWDLIVGFEGFPATVQSQAEGCRTLFEKSGLSTSSSHEYGPREGPLGEVFDVLYQGNFALRADLPLDRVVGSLSDHADLLRGSTLLADLGCGRVTAAMSELPDEAWTRWGNAALAAGGSVILEKAPQSFRRKHDVFGPVRSDWPLMHKIKAALDPGNIFAPGRMPGRPIRS
jgi:hypothetical protein